MAASLLSLVCLFSALSIALSEYQLRSLGKMEVAKPAFLGPFYAREGHVDLVVTSFSGMKSGEVYLATDIDRALNDLKAVSFTKIAPMGWPNDFITAPPGMFHDCDFAIVVADGFLVPGKNTGNLFLIKSVNGKYMPPVPMTTPRDSYFFHQAKFVDMNGDGLLDILSARATKPAVGKAGGELVWFEQPQNASAFPWPTHVVSRGGDVFFVAEDLDNDPSTLEIVAPCFFTDHLTLTVWDIASQKVTLTRQLDDLLGPGYAIVVTDLNMDGRRDLLVTNHAEKTQTPGMFAYEIPNNMETGNFTKHLLARGFPVDAKGEHQAAPGVVYAVHPNTQNTGEHPVILLAGDGAERAYQFVWAGDWQYNQTEIAHVDGVVGALAAFDANRDGWLEVFVPDYKSNLVHVFTYSPQ